MELESKVEEGLWKRAEAGDVSAQKSVGKWFLNHSLMDNAAPWFEKAAVAGDAEALHWLAVVECEGNLNEYPCTEKYAKGFEWLTNSANAGDPVSQCQLGRILMFNSSLSPDIAGVEYLKKSAASGYAQAALELGDLYYYNLDWGDIFTPDKKIAAEWYKKASELGNAEAAKALAEMTERGEIA